VQVDPNFVIPEGYSKVPEKEVVDVYQLPESLPVPESQRVAIEVLDDILSSKFGFHFLEPVTKSIVRYKVK